MFGRSKIVRRGVTIAVLAILIVPATAGCRSQAVRDTTKVIVGGAGAGAGACEVEC